MTRPNQDDLTRRVEELQKRLSAVEMNQASGASGDPERTTRRDMFRRAGITAAGVVGGAAGLSLLNAQTVHASNTNPVLLGETNTETGAATTIHRDASGPSGTGIGTVFAASGSGGTLGVFGGGSNTGVRGSGYWGVAGSGFHGSQESGFIGDWAWGFAAGSVSVSTQRSTGSGPNPGQGAVGLSPRTGVLGLGYVPSGSGSGYGAGVIGSGITGVIGNAGSGTGVRGVVTGSGPAVYGSGASGVGVYGKGVRGGVIGSGQSGPATGTGGAIPYPGPDLFGINSGRIAQTITPTSSAGPPTFSSFQGTVAEQTRDINGVLWLSDTTGNWMPADVGGLGIGLFTATSNSGYALNHSDGKTWQPIDSSNLAISFTPTFNCQAIASLSSALWTSTPGYSQDMGIAVGTSSYSATTSTPVCWTESGGTAAYAPNGAHTDAVVPLQAGTTYYFTAVWKAAIPEGSNPSSIAAGAGPLVTDGTHSPTTLTIKLVVDSAANVASARQSRKPAARTKLAATRKPATKSELRPAKHSLPKATHAKAEKLVTYKGAKVGSFKPAATSKKPWTKNAPRAPKSSTKH